MTSYPYHLRRPEQAFSIPSILAITCAIASFFTGAFWGMILAIAAIVLGLIGVIAAMSPTVRGGLISIFSIVAGAIGIIAAVLKLVF